MLVGGMLLKGEGKRSFIVDFHGLTHDEHVTFTFLCKGVACPSLSVDGVGEVAYVYNNIIMHRSFNFVVR